MEDDVVLMPGLRRVMNGEKFRGATIYYYIKPLSMRRMRRMSAPHSGQSSVRQAKLGVSDWVQVPIEQGEDLSRMFNPIIRGWLQYYGRYFRSALYPLMRQLDRSLARWAYRKYKKLRGHLRRATHWLARISRRDSKLFAHWQIGVRRGSLVGAV